jgi:hypothetical protein
MAGKVAAHQRNCDRTESFGARLYTSYLEGSTIAVTGSVSQEIRSRGRCQAPAECPGERAG